MILRKLHVKRSRTKSDHALDNYIKKMNIITSDKTLQN